MLQPHQTSTCFLVVVRDSLIVVDVVLIAYTWFNFSFFLPGRVKLVIVERLDVATVVRNPRTV